MNRTSTTARTENHGGKTNRTPRNHYQEVADRVIAALEAGTPPRRTGAALRRAEAPAARLAGGRGARFRRCQTTAPVRVRRRPWVAPHSRSMVFEPCLMRRRLKVGFCAARLTRAALGMGQSAAVGTDHPAAVGAGQPAALGADQPAGIGAVEKTRTSTGFPPQAPQACASTIPPRPHIMGRAALLAPAGGAV